MILKEKAYAIPQHIFREPWFAPSNVYYAQTASKAKMKALRDIRYDDYILASGESVSFLSLRVKRVPSEDRYLVDDNTVLTFSQIEYRRRSDELRKHIKGLTEQFPNAKAYIRKGGYYYRHNHCGYTEYISEAGVYDIQEAADCVLGCSVDDNMHMIVIDSKHEHNNMVLKKIKQLQDRLIA